MISIFENSFGREAFVAMEAREGLPFEQALDELLDEYEVSLINRGLTKDSAVLMRFHVSDAHTQAETLYHALEGFCDKSLTTIVQQPPASGSKVALEAYHISPGNDHFKKERNGSELIVSHGSYRSIWGVLRPEASNCSPYNQTGGILNTLSQYMKRHGGTVMDNVIRTWFYVRDIDNNYGGMVDARREWFAEVGMTKDTHYIASTGIEGKAENPADLVLLNYLAVLGLDRSQVHFLSAPENLCPTHRYSVTFERGTRVNFGDRSHYYISGTASIDQNGEVLHTGNVIQQTQRTIDNITALLEGSGAAFEDMKLVIVYLRDHSDYQQVSRYLQKHMPPSTAYMIVEGAVCRTAWLIEMDGVAVTDCGDEQYAPFC